MIKSSLLHSQMRDLAEIRTPQSFNAFPSYLQERKSNKNEGARGATTFPSL